MRKVVSETQTAHFWANQVQDEARNPRKTFYFEGDTIYSYGGHFPIAAIDKQNSNIVHFTTRTYSKTTNKHISIVRYAANNKTFIYCKNPAQANRGYHAENIADFESNAQSIAKSLPNSRKPEIYLNKIAQERATLKKYAEHFKLDLTAYNLKFIYIESKDGGVKATEQELKEREERERERERQEREREAERLKEHKKNVIKWRKFAGKYEMQRAHLYSREERVDYLRYNTVTNRIETSQGIEVPLEYAKKFYLQILEIVANGNCEICGTQFLNAYEIKEINKNFIQIGCHTITIKEIKALAKQLNW